MEENDYIEAAFDEAMKAYQKGEVPVGAVIVHNGQIIGRGHNQTESAKNATRHAEMVAIDEATRSMGDFRLGEAILYVTLEPCIMCAGAAILSRLKSIIYVCPDLRHGACGSIIDLFEDHHPIHNPEVRFIDDQERSATMLRNFFKERRNGKDTRRNDRSTKGEAAQDSQ